MTKKEKAMELFSQGYNCSQSVAGAFCQEIGMDFETVAKIASSFGGGMGRLREVCGAVSGMFIVTGLLYGYGSPEDYEAKKTLYTKVQSLAFKFKEQNGSYICRELLGLDKKGSDSPVPEKRTEEYYKKRPCKLLVGDAAEILEQFIEEQKSK